MYILAVTNMYPMPQSLTLGPFVEQQINGFRQIGLDVNTMFIDRVQRRMWYAAPDEDTRCRNGVHCG
jgi:hypothetical protein